MHGSCVEQNNEQSIFLGKSGSGKSTMAYELVTNNKYKLVTEDCIMIDPANELTAIPSYPCIKIHPDHEEQKNNLKILTSGKHDSLKRILLEIPDKSFATYDKSSKITEIFFMEWSDKNRIKSLTREEGFKNLFKHTMRYLPKLEDKSIEKNIFNMSVNLANKAKSYMIHRKDFSDNSLHDVLSEIILMKKNR